MDHAAGHFAKGVEALLADGLALGLAEFVEGGFEFLGALGHALVQAPILLAQAELEEAGLEQVADAQAAVRSSRTVW